VSDQGLRKVLYQKVSQYSSSLSCPVADQAYIQIVATFPEGWMTSGQISRDGTHTDPLTKFNAHVRYCSTLVSAMKKRMEKEAMEEGDDD
jgi:hypothetical protein